MAINIKKYVDISTSFPKVSTSTRSFGGLVFTASTPIVQTEGGLVDAYQALISGSVAYLTLDEVGTLFGAGVYDASTGTYTTPPSDEYMFANNYYSYLSPSGRIPSRLAVSLVLSGETPLTAFNRVCAVTNLFGSFTFLSTAGSGGDSTSSSQDRAELTQLKEVAAYNSGLDAKFLFVINRVRGDLSASAVTLECAEFANFSGTVFVSGATAVSGYMPMAILASTDFSTGSVVNYMFKQFGNETPTVFDDTTYMKFNQGCVNFYGRTQTNGQTMDFYQRGFNTNGMDTSLYCNEMWLKSACETAIMQLLVSNERLSADNLGADLVKLEVLSQCAIASRNGMFMAKTPSEGDLRGIREIIADADDVEGTLTNIESGIVSAGYSVYAFLTNISNSEIVGKSVEKAIVYYIFYGTADSVRYVRGNDILLK